MFRYVNKSVLLQCLMFVTYAASQNYPGFKESVPDSDDGLEQQKKQKTCEDGMTMVQNYLETSKIELIENIRAAKSVQCKLQEWKKVDRSMINYSHSHGVKYQLKSDETFGLMITAKATDSGCGTSSKGASLTVHIKGDWQQIMFTQMFKGSCKCWRIFGASGLDETTNSGLEPFSRSMGDVIFGQKKMKSLKENIFEGADTGCGGFWGPQNGNGERQATVMLRRRKGSKDAGIYTRTFCGNSEYEIKDIYVLM